METGNVMEKDQLEWKNNENCESHKYYKLKAELKLCGWPYRIVIVFAECLYPIQEKNTSSSEETREYALRNTGT